MSRLKQVDGVGLVALRTESWSYLYPWQMLRTRLREVATALRGMKRVRRLPLSYGTHDTPKAEGKGAGKKNNGARNVSVPDRQPVQ